MKKTGTGLALLGSVILAATVWADPQPKDRLAGVRVPFVENRGQLDPRVAFAARTLFGTAFVTRDGKLVYALPGSDSKGWSLTESLVSGHSHPSPGPRSKTQVSQFHGRDPKGWQAGLGAYDEVQLGEVWPGVSVSLRAHGGNVEKLFTVEPGARVARILVRVDGTSGLRVDPDGTLVAATGNGDVRFTAPVAYQDSGGMRCPVEVAYDVRGKRYGFRLGAHDPSLPVVVDPLLQSTYLGGSLTDQISAIALSSAGDEVLVAGNASSTDFPGTNGGAQTLPGGGIGDCFVARLDEPLTTLLQATYLGGGGQDIAWGIAVDPSGGDVFVTGDTDSTDFPGTTGGAQPEYAGSGDGFVARLDATLTSLLQATYVGGGAGDRFLRIVVHPATSDVVVAGFTFSQDFPGTAGGAQPSYGGGPTDGVVCRLNPTLSMLTATYLGGTGYDYALGMTIHPLSSDVVVTGYTGGGAFPGTSGGAQAVSGGGTDAFVSRLAADLTTLLQSTYLGGQELDNGTGVAVHPASGEIFVTGETSSNDFPHTIAGAQPTIGGSKDGFVASFDSDLTILVQSTYLGGSGDDTSTGILVHPSSGEIVVCGVTLSSTFPGSDTGAQPDHGGGLVDGFLARLDPWLGELRQTTYFGGSDQEGLGALVVATTTGNVLTAGSTWSVDLPAVAGGAQQAIGGIGFFDGFIGRLSPDLEALLAPAGLNVDPLPNPGDGNHIFEPGESIPVAPVWHNISDATYTPTGQASAFGGPAGGTYELNVSTVSYTEMLPGDFGIPAGAYNLAVPIPDIRPDTHWDAVFTETLDVPTVLPKKWTLHLGDSFPDVPRSDSFYAFIENILHNEITSGCGGGNYCAASSVTRAQMAAFLLKAKHGAAFVPTTCLGIFLDVECPGLFADWIEQLSFEGITAGCGGGKYCPDSAVTRKQMAAFLLKTKQGSAYTPPPAGGIFGDVPLDDSFAPWIEELYTRGVTGGCQAAPLLYCPENPNTRGQMAVFLVKTFGLLLYGP